MNDIALERFESNVCVTRYVKRGFGSEVILLIHGMGCSSLEWSENIDYLSTHMTVIAVDLVGFGASDKPFSFDYSAAGQATQLLALMDELKILNFHIVGNSFGGKVAIEMANAAQQRVKSLTLVASAGAGSDAPLPMRLSTIPIVGSLLRRPNFEEFKKDWNAAFYNSSLLSNERVEKKYKDSLVAGAHHSHLQTVRSMINLWGFKRSDIDSMKRKIRAIRCRVLIVWGRQDVMLPVAHAQIFKSLIPGSQLHVFEQCGHAPQIEKSVEFNLLVNSFVMNN